MCTLLLSLFIEFHYSGTNEFFKGILSQAAAWLGCWRPSLSGNGQNAWKSCSQLEKGVESKPSEVEFVAHLI